MPAAKFNHPMWSKEVIEQVSKKIDLYTRSHKDKIDSISSTPEDFRQEILSKWCQQRGYENYQSEKKSLNGYIYLVCYRHLGDMVRKKFRKSNIPFKISIYEELNSDGFTLADTLQDNSAINSRLLKEMLDMLPDDFIEIEEKTLSITYKQLFEDFITFDVKEIALNYGYRQKDIKEALEEIKSFLQFTYDL